MITGRQLLREEIEQVWDIGRSEVIDHVYYLEKELSCSSQSINCSWLAPRRSREIYAVTERLLCQGRVVLWTL